MSFIQFGPGDTILDTEAITAPLWSNNVYKLTGNSMYTSSAQESSITGKSYLNVNQSLASDVGSELQYSIAYGHLYGSGSAPFNVSVPQNTPTRDIYGQFRNLVFGDENSTFNFGIAAGSKDIYVLNISRSRYKESLKPGSFNLTLKSGANIIKLTDNSNDVAVNSYIGTMRVFDIVSGSNGASWNATAIQTSAGSYGIFLPDISTIILNPRALALDPSAGGISLASIETATTAYNANNAQVYDALVAGDAFSLNSYETISSRYYQTKVGFNDFNYTTNPSVIDDKGNVLYSTLINNPETFMTGVGLYTAHGELVAVAKLSQPLKKNYTTPINLNVKLQS